MGELEDYLAMLQDEVTGVRVRLSELRAERRSVRSR